MNTKKRAIVLELTDGVFSTVKDDEAGEALAEILSDLRDAIDAGSLMVIAECADRLEDWKAQYLGDTDD